MGIPRSLNGILATYGDPRGAGGGLDRDWYKANIVRVIPPYPMVLAWAPKIPVSAITCHRLAADELRSILSDIYNRARLAVKREVGFDKPTEFYDTETLRYLQNHGLHLYGGGFNFRYKRGGRSLSTHSWGIAIDLDPARNGMGNANFAMPPFAVEAFEERGWLWGGRWKGRGVDAMHFQRATGY